MFVYNDATTGSFSRMLMMSFTTIVVAFNNRERTNYYTHTYWLRAGEHVFLGVSIVDA